MAELAALEADIRRRLEVEWPDFQDQLTRDRIRVQDRLQSPALSESERAEFRAELVDIAGSFVDLNDAAREWKSQLRELAELRGRIERRMSEKNLLSNQDRERISALRSYKARLEKEVYGLRDSRSKRGAIHRERVDALVEKWLEGGR